MSSQSKNVSYSVTIKDNSKKWMANQAIKNQRALRKMGMEIVNNTSDRLTPLKEGDLRDSGHIEGMGNEIKVVFGNSRIRYAAAQEVGITHGQQITHYTTPGTGKKYLKRNGDKVVKKGIKKFL